MADVIQRVWRSGPRKVKRTAWGYTFQHAGRQVRKFSATWSKEQAQDALAAALLERDAPAPPEPVVVTLQQLRDRYVAYKEAEGKRSIGDDKMNLTRLLAWFGAALPVTEISAERIADYGRARAAEKSKLGRLVSPATRNRELATLRHMLRLAHEWGYIEKVPRIRLAREPEGRLRYLSDDEAERLLKACRDSQSPNLHAVVTLALHTGMRRGEILGLTWERVDVARGVLLLEQTKSGRRREVPMNRPVYDALTAMRPKAPAEAEGRVFRRRGGPELRGIRSAFERACTTAKVHGFRFHDLRHTCASWLVMRGRHLKEVQELLGHRTFTMTLRYAHLAPERLREAVASLETAPTARGSAQRQHTTVQSEPVAP